VTGGPRASGVALTALAAALVFAWGGSGIGSGWIDGDAAAYAAQIATGHLTERWTHVGYVAAGVALRATGLDPTLALDLLSLLASVATVLLAGRRAGPVAAWGAAAAVLPWASFGEVDPVWIALVLAALRLPWLVLPAVAVSPVALLAVPWLALEEQARARAYVGWAALAVFTLTAASGGAWWTGERGVLEVAPLLPGRTALTWALHASPLLVLLAGTKGASAPLLGLAGLVFVPPDVPAWVLGSIGVAIVAARTRRPAAGVIVVAMTIGLVEHHGRVSRVRQERDAVEAIARLLGPDDGLVAPFTWGARVAVHATGDPYGLRWHPPGAFLRDQEELWCGDPPARALVMDGGPLRWTTAVRCDP
jgi:hypothetical protein